MPLLVSRPAIFPAVRYRNSTGSGTSPCRRPLQLLAALSASRISHTCMCRARYLGRQLLRWDCLKRPQNCSLKCGMARMRTSSRHRKCARQKIRRPLGSNHSSVRSSLLRICRLPENTFQRKCTQVPINAESEKNREKAHVRFCDLPRLTARVRGSAPSLNSYFAIQVTQSDAVSFGVFQYVNLFIRNSFFIGFYRQDVGFIKAYLIIGSKGCKLLAVINFFPKGQR